MMDGPRVRRHFSPSLCALLSIIQGPSPPHTRVCQSFVASELAEAVQRMNRPCRGLRLVKGLRGLWVAYHRYILGRITNQPCCRHHHRDCCYCVLPVSLCASQTRRYPSRRTAHKPQALYFALLAAIVDFFSIVLVNAIPTTILGWW